MDNIINEPEQRICTEPIETIAKSIFANVAGSIKNITCEIGLDGLLQSDVVKELPIAKMVHIMAKTSLAIRDIYLLKKTLAFIAALNEGNVDPKEIEKRRKAVKENKKWIRDEVERLTVHLDRLDETEKAKLTGAFYAEFLNGHISWWSLLEYLAVIERVFIEDFKQVLGLYQFQMESEEAQKLIVQGISSATMKLTTELSCDRLIAIGLVTAQRKPLAGGLSSDFNLTGLGIKFAEVLVKMDWKEDRLRLNSTMAVR